MTMTPMTPWNFPMVNNDQILPSDHGNFEFLDMVMVKNGKFPVLFI